MIFVHEVHEVAGGKMEEFGEAVRTVWRPLIEEHRQARLLWFWELAHGTGASYQAVSLTAVRDWAAWGDLVARAADFREWRRHVSTLRREVGQAAADVFEVAVAKPGVELEPAPQPLLGLGVVQVPLVHLPDHVPVDP